MREGEKTVLNAPTDRSLRIFCTEISSIDFCLVVQRSNSFEVK